MGTHEVPSQISNPSRDLTTERLHPPRKIRGYHGLMVDVWGSPPIWDEPTQEEILNAQLRREHLDMLFKDPEKASEIAEGIEIALAQLDQRAIRALKMCYGLDDPEEKGMTLKKLGYSLIHP